MVDNPADIAYDEIGMTSPTTYGGYDYGAAVQAEAPVSDGRGQAEILERQGGTSAQDGNRPGVPGTLGEERGNLRQLYLRERHRVSSAPELYRIEDCVTPAAGSEAERIQSRFRKEYGLGCYMVKNSAWSIKLDACFEDGIIYFREGIAPEILSMLVEPKATHAMKRTNFSPYMNFTARVLDMMNIGTEV